MRTAKKPSSHTFPLCHYTPWSMRLHCSNWRKAAPWWMCRSKAVSWCNLWHMVISPQICHNLLNIGIYETETPILYIISLTIYKESRLQSKLTWILTSGWIPILHSSIGHCMMLSFTTVHTQQGKSSLRSVLQHQRCKRQHGSMLANLRSFLMEHSESATKKYSYSSSWV